MTDTESTEPQADHIPDAEARRTRDLATLAVLAAVPWVMTLFLLMWDIPQNLRPSLSRTASELPVITTWVLSLARPLPCMAVMACGTVGVGLIFRLRSKAVAWGLLLLGTVLLVGMYVGGYYVLEKPDRVRQVVGPNQ